MLVSPVLIWGKILYKKGQLPLWIRFYLNKATTITVDTLVFKDTSDE